MSSLDKNKFSATGPVPQFGSLILVQNKTKCLRLQKWHFLTQNAAFSK